MNYTLRPGEPMLLLALLHDLNWHETAQTAWRPALGKPTLKELQLQLGTDAYGYALRHYLELTQQNYQYYRHEHELSEQLALQLALLETTQLDFHVLNHPRRPETLLLTINLNQARNGQLTRFVQPLPPTQTEPYEQLVRQMTRTVRRTIWQTACGLTPQNR